jgi:hypothetical protein
MAESSMRYIYQEPIIHTVKDEDVNDDKAVRAVLQELKDLNHNVFMEFGDQQNPDHMQRLNVRITAIHEDTIDFTAYYSNALMKFQKVPILAVRKVRLLANKAALAKKYKISRWHMMDVAEIDGL